MQRILIIVFVLSLSFFSVSDAAEVEKPKEPATKIEAFLSKKGEVIIKNYYEVGSHFYPGNITLKAIVIYKPGQEAQKTRGMKIEVLEAGRLERSNTSFLDIDEVESLQKALVYLESAAEKMSNAEDNTEVIYSTKGDFAIGFFKTKDAYKGFASSGIIGRTTVFFPIEEFKTVRGSVEKGLQILRQK